MNDEKLILKLQNLVQIERKTLSQILVLLQKVYETKLYAKLGYSNLIKFMVRELKYSESAAFRRYQALRLTYDVPETKKMIESGELNLSKVTKIQTLLKDESIETKKKMSQEIVNQTTQEAEKTIFKLCPKLNHEKIKDELKRQSSSTVRFSTTISDSTITKLDQVKARTKIYESDELIKYLCEFYLKHQVKARRSRGSKLQRGITAQVKRKVTSRAQHRCEHKGCDEIHFLEFDHIRPVSKGGDSHLDNIRLVCRAHNMLYAMS